MLAIVLIKMFLYSLCAPLPRVNYPKRYIQIDK
jgi:hypothetical protein